MATANKVRHEITTATQREVAAMVNGGATMVEAARRYGVAVSTVHRIVHEARPKPRPTAPTRKPGRATHIFRWRGDTATDLALRHVRHARAAVLSMQWSRQGQAAAEQLGEIVSWLERTE